MTTLVAEEDRATGVPSTATTPGHAAGAGKEQRGGRIGEHIGGGRPALSGGQLRA